MSKEDQQHERAGTVGGSVSALPPMQREFAEEGTRLANLWQYFSEHRMQLPRQIVEQIRELSTLPSAEQIATMRRVNKELMEFLNDVGEGSGVRQ